MKMRASNETAIAMVEIVIALNWKNKNRMRAFRMIAGYGEEKMTWSVSPAAKALGLPSDAVMRVCRQKPVQEETLKKVVAAINAYHTVNGEPRKC